MVVVTHRGRNIAVLVPAEIWAARQRRPATRNTYDTLRITVSGGCHPETLKFRRVSIHPSNPVVLNEGRGYPPGIP